MPLDTLPPTIVLTGRDALPKNKKDGIFSRMEKVFTAPAGATHIIVGSFNKPKRGDFSREYVYIDSIGAGTAGNTTALPGSAGGERRSTPRISAILCRVNTVSRKRKSK